VFAFATTAILFVLKQYEITRLNEGYLVNLCA
jgi:hypothetical protein